jgi:ankyrin repeat protein
MPSHSEVVRLNLEYYRKQSKALLRAAKAGESDALQRLYGRVAKLNQREAPALHDAQLAIAREQGFASWPRFKAFIVESQLDFQGLVTEFIDAAVSDRRRAKEIMAAHPQIANAGFYVALVLGDWKQVASALSAIPSLPTTKSGPQNCESLLYVCFSRHANGKSDRAADLTETARLLLRHGADPNAFFLPKEMPDHPLSCLYGASGLNNNPALTLVLLEAGANPNDGESLYHSTEHHDLACMKLLLKHGVTPNGTNALKHILDREDIEGLQLLLAAGANPNETNERGETALHWAVWRGRNSQVISTLLDDGAEPDTPRQDGRTAYALAVLGGQSETAALLQARGAKTELSALDQFVGAFAVASPDDRKSLLVSRPEFKKLTGSERLLPDLAITHRTSGVRALLAAGVAVDSRGEAGGTALHWACWKGYADVVEVLLDNGASLVIEDQQFHAPPSGWLHHGTENCDEPGGKYAQVARLLIAAGDPMKGCNRPTNHPEVDAVLREHKLIE